MITTTAESTAVRRQPTRRSLTSIILTETRFEFLKLWRLPTYSLATLAFPLMFFVMFGSFYGQFEAQGLSVAKYMVATFSAAGLLSAGMFAFGVGVASERGQGWMRLKRVSPMPPIAYFAAKMGMALVFGMMVIISITLAGMLIQGVRFGLLEWFAMVGVLLLGVFPFSALGLAFGYLFGPNSAPIVLNLIYMPMAFASGLWMPVTILPAVVQKAATFLPTYDYAQLSLSTIGASPLGESATHVLVLATYTVVFLALAVFAYRRDEGKTYG